ncbi:MAG: HNH endonuclease [Chloroflexi bacterium]|nr:HNH endonuclease [Chloroflexota bacterium]
MDASGGLLACWPFVGNGTAAGYGQLSIGRGKGRMIAAHRLSYELAVGPIPSGMVVRHTCDNPPCVNPAHLVVGAPVDNVRDMVDRNRRRGRTLTADQVADLRLRAAAGESYRDLAASAGVDASTIARIVKGRTWAVA